MREGKHQQHRKKQEIIQQATIHPYTAVKLKEISIFSVLSHSLHISKDVDGLLLLMILF